jgi:multidrug efflux system outer membrane protein
MKFKTLPLALALATLTLSGCAYMAPHYDRPESPVADQWSLGIAGTPTSGDVTASVTPWRQFFVDEKLQRLIQTALENNRDLRVTALNVEKTQAMYRIQRADLFPTVGISGIPQQAIQSAGGGLSSGSPTTHSYAASVGIASYELDLFGRVASLKDAALETYLSSESALASGKIALVATVANAYLNLVADREHLKVARETLTSQTESYALIKQRYDKGIANELALRQAEISVQTARVDLATYTTQVSQDVNALVLLLGTKNLPEEIVAEEIKTLDALPALNTGEMPSEVLFKRPDIAAAEHQLKSAYANIGAARAAFFPRISLTTAIGTASTALSDLFGGGSGIWAFATNLTLPIWDSGRNLANLDVANVNRDIALAQYEKSIQSAFREVSDALVQRATIDAQLDAQTALYKATADSHTIATKRYDAGVDSYLNVLDAQRSMYSARQGLVSLQLAKQVNIINLYKALGGGLE